MASSKYDDNIQQMKDIRKIPEGVGIAEDSGFASLAGSVITEASDGRTHTDNTLICDDNIKFSDIPLGNSKVSEKKTKDEAKREAEDEYDREKKEQTYKRLMHLLNKSKFYSNYIIEKINKSDGVEKPKAGEKRKIKRDEKKSNDYKSPPVKRSKRIAKVNKKYDIREYISDDIQKNVQRKMNLSQEEIAEELNTESESEDNQSSVTSAFVKPKYFEGNLWEYQQEGLQWLKVLYENGLNGILADEMGLGKTIQVIALLCYLIEKEQPGPYLIIVPLSTLPNWLTEFEKFSPTLPYMMMYGTKNEKTEASKKINSKFTAGDGRFKTYPIVITTYETTISERTLKHHNWRYIIIDEGQRIKNHKCQLVRVLKSYKSMNRLLLTGTPLQNNLSELWSLLHFLLPDIFDDHDVFQSWFNSKELQNDEGTARFLKQEQEKRVMSSLREILKPFMLRREKKDVNINIPPKKEIIVYAPITELQRDLYTATLNRDYHTMTKVEAEPVILDDETGVRPKRKCLSRHKYSAAYQNPYDTTHNRSQSSTSTFSDDNDSRDYRTPQLMENQQGNETTADSEQHLVEIWKQYANVTDRNYNFFIRLTVMSRMMMYRKIINHPYLVHCPLDDGGLPRIDEDLVKDSGKLLILDAMLKKLHARGHKVLLFSTMTMLLDVIGDYLNLREWKYVRLDGDTKIKNRKKNIALFNSDPSIFLFLISTRAGGVGLNLVAADTVIMYDSDWNPQADLQAMARCHRIGQTRPVVIYRLCTKGTIDEVVIRRAGAKRKLEKMVISKELSMDMNKAETILELKRLLDSSDSEVITSENKVFTEDELDALIDRNDMLDTKQLDDDGIAGTSKEKT